MNGGDDVLSLNGGGRVSLSDDSIVFITDYKNSNPNIEENAKNTKDAATWFRTSEENDSKSIVDFSLQYLETKNAVSSWSSVTNSLTGMDDWVFRTLGLENDTWEYLRLAIKIFIALILTGILIYLLFGR
jgi:hypothetical protein